MRLLILTIVSVGLPALACHAQVQAPPAPPGIPVGPTLPPPPPLPPAPLDFRQLLSMAPAERDKVLGGRNLEDRKVIEAKLKEYEALPPEVREARLRALQLRLYLRPLMKVSASNRVERLEAIPEPDRGLIAERLAFWDQLGPEMQRELLDNELALNWLVDPDLALPQGRLPVVSPQRQAAIDAAIARWRALPEEKRHQIHEHFQSMFQLDERQKAKSLQPLSDAERRQMERTVETFRKFSRAQREACIAAVHRFTELSPSERQAFLRKVELWQDMTPKERQLWRDLVARFRIPRPPVPPVPPPPVPRVQPKREAGTLIATNN